MLGREAATQFDLDRVTLVPTGQAAHKRIDPEPGGDVRLRLTEAAAAGDPLFEVSAIEIEFDGPSFSANTLARLHEERPDDEFVFLMGADAAAGLESWHEPQRVLELARIGIAARPGSSLAVVDGIFERLSVAGGYELIRMPELAISSSELRRRIAAGESIRYLVPEAVEDAIAGAGLYRAQVRA